MSNAFFDASCRKCKRRIGWTGKVTDQPPCPTCGTEPDRAQLKADQDEIESFQKLLAEMKKKNPAFVTWQPARVKAGLTLRQAAELLGITPSDLSAFENGRYIPTAEQITAMGKLYSGEWDGDE